MTATYENPWIFNGRAFEDQDIAQYEGFVYCITNNASGKKYIGRKYFYAKSKGKRRKVSDWKFYYGSSKDLSEDIQLLGQSSFSRQILSLHKTRGSTNYTEIEEQVMRRVLHDDNYYNLTIAGKYRIVDVYNVEYDYPTHTDAWLEKHSKFMRAYNREHTWINNGKKEIRHPKDVPVPEGWETGRKSRTLLERKKHGDSIRDAWKDGKYSKRKISPKFKDDPAKKREYSKKMRNLNTGENNPRFGKKNSESHKRAIADSIRGTKWINNGEINKRVTVDTLDGYLCSGKGWKLGSIQKRKVKKYIDEQKEFSK